MRLGYSSLDLRVGCLAVSLPKSVLHFSGLIFRGVKYIILMLGLSMPRISFVGDARHFSFQSRRYSNQSHSLNLSRPIYKRSYIESDLKVRNDPTI